MKFKRTLFTVLGFVFLGFGAIGVVATFIPFMIFPTTPFVLLAAACFSISNERMYEWLRKNKIFGPFIENYRTKRGISIWHKIGGIAFLWIGLTISMIMVRAIWIYVLLGIVGICVTIHLLLIKTKKPLDPLQHQG